MRKVLGAFCYLAVLAADGAAAYYSYLAYTQKISYQQGFLTFMPIFIVTYWFSTSGSCQAAGIKTADHI